MIVRCKGNYVDDSFPYDLYAYWIDRRLERTFPLTIGATYPVVAIVVNQGIPWYYIHDDDNLSWPIWYPASLFEVFDGTFPESWVYDYVTISRDVQFPIISFPEWANDRFFYERLVEGEPSAERAYAVRRAEVTS